MANPFQVSSLLFVPGVSERNLRAAIELRGADKPALVTFDLEDSVAPERKAEARRTLVQHLLDDEVFRERVFASYQVRIRINPPGSPWFEEDLAAARELRPNYLAIPKLESAQMIDHLRLKLANDAIQFLVGIETIPGINRLPEILKAFTSRDGFVIGYEDLCAQLGIRRPQLLSDPSPLYYLICQALVHAKYYNIAIFDGMHRGIGSPTDLANLRSECEYSYKLGFDGKVAIHPRQVSVINDVFDKRLALLQARNIIRLLEARPDGKSVVVDETGEMIGPPAKSFAERTLANLAPSVEPPISRESDSEPQALRSAG